MVCLLLHEMFTSGQTLESEERTLNSVSLQRVSGVDHVMEVITFTLRPPPLAFDASRVNPNGLSTSI